MDKKERKRRKEETGKAVKIRLNPKEVIVLNHLMEKEGWTNAAGFFRDKVFGEDLEEKFNRVVTSKKANYPAILTELFDSLNKNLTYLGYRFENELIDIKKQSGDNDATIRKWASIIENWKDGINENFQRFFCTANILLKSLEIDPVKIKYNPADVYPDYILEAALEDDFEGDPNLVQIARQWRYEQLKAIDEAREKSRKNSR